MFSLRVWAIGGEKEQMDVCVVWAQTVCVCFLLYVGVEGTKADGLICVRQIGLLYLPFVFLANIFSGLQSRILYG